MDFTGRLYFDFIDRDVWRFLQVLLAAQREGVQLGLEWKPFLVDGLPEGELSAHGRLLAASEIVRTDAVMAHGPFVSAVLTAIHGERMDLEDPDVMTLAVTVAQLDDGFMTDAAIQRRGRVLLEAAQEEAQALGVDAVPSVVRHGPVVAVRMTAAVAMGSGSRRLELIDAMLEDDGLWELRKP